MSWTEEGESLEQRIVTPVRSSLRAALGVTCFCCLLCFHLKGWLVGLLD